MKFVLSKLEKTADNSRGKESWKDKLKNLTSVICVLLVLYFVIGLLADFVAMRISEDTEGKVFGSAFSVLQSESAPPEFGQTEEIFDRLIRNSELRPLPYSLVYWDENTPNAFAAPGGGVIVTQGLLDTVTNETALAFVLSHELGHHQHRHTLRGIGRSLLISLVFNYIFGSTGGDVVSGAVKLAELGHSRHDERQADDFGFRLAYASFGNADGYLDFFKKLRDEYESHNTYWLKFLNSHPPTGERLDELKKLRDQLGER